MLFGTVSKLQMINNFNFEWDEDKACENLKKHKISFEEARTIFNDPFLITILNPQDSTGRRNSKRTKNNAKALTI